ncbi:hypothetical protein BIW11_11170, partial [Tropilaelaps mercedesae]
MMSPAVPFRQTSGSASSLLGRSAGLYGSSSSRPSSRLQALTSLTAPPGNAAGGLGLAGLGLGGGLGANSNHSVGSLGLASNAALNPLSSVSVGSASRAFGDTLLLSNGLRKPLSLSRPASALGRARPSSALGHPLSTNSSLATTTALQQQTVSGRQTNANHPSSLTNNLVTPRPASALGDPSYMSKKQTALIRQLEEELRIAHMQRNPDAELQSHLDALYAEKDHMTKEIFLLRETIKELELRIETQKQTLAARDESIKKLMEMLQSSKGVGSQLLDEQRIENERLRGRLIEAEARTRHLESMLENLKRDQDRGDLGKNRQ